MSLPIHKKLFWKSKNFLEYKFLSLTNRGSGCLSHREDNQDIPFGLFNSQAHYEAFTLDTGVRFDQERLNICVFASRVQGRSIQTGIRFSVRSDVKLAKKLGWITGNGWSSLRAENEIGVKYGRVPYELCPDEINGMSWEEYSEWTAEDERLLNEVAPHYKTPEYQKIWSWSQAVKALEDGLVLFTAGKWYLQMNAPQAPKYLLQPFGPYYGGHAYIGTGYRGRGDDFENPQTFGTTYGDNGKAWIDDLFGANQYAIYIELDLPLSSYLHYYEGKDVKAKNGAAVYHIEDGKKKAYLTEEEFVATGRSFTDVKTIKLDVLSQIPDA